MSLNATPHLLSTWCMHSILLTLLQSIFFSLCFCQKFDTFGASINFFLFVSCFLLILLTPVIYAINIFDLIMILRIIITLKVSAVETKSLDLLKMSLHISFSIAPLDSVKIASELASALALCSLNFSLFWGNGANATDSFSFDLLPKSIILFVWRATAKLTPKSDLYPLLAQVPSYPIFRGVSPVLSSTSTTSENLY